jgi:hypothetical protein
MSSPYCVAEGCFNYTRNTKYCEEHRGGEE